VKKRQPSAQKAQAVEPNTPSPPKHDRFSVLLEPTFVLAGLTAFGYACTFRYQSGYVAYYGLPAETVRLSIEWLAYIGAALAIPALAYVLYGARVVTPVLLLLVAALGYANGLITATPAIAMVAVSILVLALSTASWWLRRRIQIRGTEGTRQTTPAHKDLRVDVTLTLILFFVLFAYARPVGFMTAQAKTTYELVKGTSEVVVYSSSSSLVAALYSPRDHTVLPVFTYYPPTPSQTGFHTTLSHTGRLESGRSYGSE